MLHFLDLMHQPWEALYLPVFSCGKEEINQWDIGLKMHNCIEKSGVNW